MDIEEEKLKKLFEERGYTFVGILKENGRIFYNYICPKHIDKGILKIRKDAFNREQGCRYCSYEKNGALKKYDTDKFKKIVFNLVGDEYTVLGEYSLANDNILMKHNICGKEYFVTPGHFINGCRCPYCLGRYRNTDEFKNLIFNLVGNEYEILGQYESSKKKILIKHNLCNYEYLIAPYKFLQGNRCPICNQSKGEKRIEEYFINNNISYVIQKEFKGLIGVKNHNLSYDFYLPKENLLIEYQGQYHDGTVKKQTKEEFLIQKEHDKRKKEYAIINNINLLEIWYWDYDNIEIILDKELK